MNEKQPIIFDREYARSYDTVSGDIKAYEVWAKNLTNRLLENKPDAKNVLEIGSGTGNSAAVLLENAPSIENVYGVEANDFVFLARAKQESNVEAFYHTKESPAYSREMAQRLKAYKNKLHLIQAHGENLPIKEESIDAVFMNQVFHWLKPNEALKEIRRVLKPNGILVFDESEFQFDFGDTAEGQSVKREQTIR